MEEKKYSIVINYINGAYVMVFKSWDLDEEGNNINVINFAKRNLTLKEVKDKIKELK